MFDEDKTQETPESTPAVGEAGSVSSNGLDTLLASIKNERGEQKYQSPEEALKGAAHAQQYISELKSQLADMKNKLGELETEGNARSAVEEAFDTLSAQGQGDVNTTRSSLDEDAVLAILQKRETEQVKTANREKIKQMFVSQYGDAAAKKFGEVASELGLTTVELTELAERSPAVIQKVVGQAPTPSPAFSRSSVNTESFASRNPETNIKANGESIFFADSNTLQREAQRAKAMVDELESHGLSIRDLTKPSNFFKYMG